MAVRMMRYGKTEVDNSIIDHNLLVNRTLPNQHTIESISGLRLELDEKYVKPDTGIPIDDLGFTPVTEEEFVILKNDVDNRIIVVKADISSVGQRTTAIEDFLNNIYGDESTGVPSDATINFAYREGFREDFISEEGDTEFHLIHTFVADKKHLRVYREGELLTPDVDYVEESNNKIRLLYPLEPQMYMSFVCDTMSTVVSPIHEEIISIVGQTEFNLKNAYKVGDHSLSIFVDGKRLEKDTHYEEVGPNDIKLLIDPYNVGTKLIFRQESVQSAGKVLYHEKDYQQKSWKFNCVVTQDQQIIELDESYIPGTNMICVTVQGMGQWLGDDFDYTELDDKHIKFNYPLDEGEKVSVFTIHQIYNWSEKFVSLDGQTVFELSNIYYTGRDDIVVQENGLQISVDDDYLEISNTAIKLLEPPPVGSKITVFKRR